MKELRKGYTTGSCAQAAAKAAALMLMTGRALDSVEVETPSGLKICLPVVDPVIEKSFACCGVLKDSGDDPDITHGAKICATVMISERQGVTLRGGKGVGIVTRPGLAVPVGEYAINPTPRKMILKEVSSLLGEGQGLEVTITVPEGEALAGKTFNPRLGIVGGISILGTTGIVEPKSMDAYKTSLSLQVDVLKASGGGDPVLVLGYVGERFCRTVLRLPAESIIKIGDHVGFMLQECGKKGFKGLLLVGHIGKLVKVAAGQFNTHYRSGDPRIETLVLYARTCGAGPDVIEALRRETAAEATVRILKENDLMEVFASIAREVVRKGKHLTGGKLRIRVILLSLEGEVLGDHEE